jgi:hypothetical protein
MAIAGAAAGANASAALDRHQPVIQFDAGGPVEEPKLLDLASFLGPEASAKRGP